MAEYSKTSLKVEQFFHDNIKIYKILNFDVLPPLVVVFLQFWICMRFPRHLYKDMVLLSTVAFVAIEQWMLFWWKPGQYSQI